MEKVQHEPECCPEFKPAIWENQVFEWDNKMFIRDKVFTLFFMPVNFGGAMKRLNGKVEKAGAGMPDWLCLSDHTSKWNMDLYLAVDRHIGGAENTTLSGKYFSKVYEGPFRDTGKWTEDFKKHAKERGFEIMKWYMWYTTCPKCAKKYGKNYVVIICSISGEPAN
ncbi:MAG: hydrolase [Bacteroidota bacterium]